MPQPKGISETITHALKEYASLQGKEPLCNVWPTIMQEVERSLITFSLAQAKGNKRLAAQILGINRNTLYKKMDQYNLNSNEA
jgi:Fis family transcriptional regulator